MNEKYHRRQPQRNRFNRRRLVRGAALLGASLSGAALLGCSGRNRAQTSSQAGTPPASGNTKPQPGGTYKFYLPNNATLDPQALSQVPTNQVAGGVMSRLFRFKTGPDPKVVENHDVEGDLALSAESPDAITWTIKLRPGTKFQNVAPVSGHAVEAEDVKATFVRALSLPQNPNRGALGMIDPNQIQTPAKDTVTFKLKYAYAPFQKTLASPTYSWVFPREALAGSYDPSKRMIGSGPFLLDNATPDVAFTMKKNPDWFEQGRPYVDGVSLAVVPANAQQQAQFTSGNLDEIWLAASDLDSMKRSNPKAKVFTLQPYVGGTVYPSLGDPSSPFQDIRIRRAFSMALDRESLAKSVFGGQYVDQLFVPLDMGKWALPVNQLDASTAQYFKYNPSQAKALLQEAGAQNLDLKVAYVTNGSLAVYPWYKATAEAVSNMLNAVGVKNNLLPLDFKKDYLDAGKGYRQGFFPKDTVAFATNQPFTEVDEFIFSYFDSKSTQNETHLNDSALDTMIDKARTLVNEDERLKAYLEIQRYIAEKLYVVTTGSTPVFIMVQPHVQNFNPGTQSGEVAETYTKLWLAQ